MKKGLILTLFIPFLTIGCFKNKTQIKVDETKVASISLNASSISLSVGSSFQLQATVLPTTAEDRTVTWSSGNDDIASVRYGKVTGVSVF